MPVVRRARAIALAMVLPAVGLSTAGCGASRQTTGMLTATAQRGDQALRPGLLTPGDLPGGFRLAADHDLFRGFRPAASSCRLLFSHADGAGDAWGERGDGRAAHTVLYQIEPGGSLEERVLLLAPGEAARRLRLLRGLGDQCRRFAFPAIAGRLDMRRTRSSVPRLGDDSCAVRFTGRVSPGMSVRLDWFAARVARGLLVLARSSLAVGAAARTGITPLIAHAAVARLQRLFAAHRPARS
jgi:hypothetical protein